MDTDADRNEAEAIEGLPAPDGEKLAELGRKWMDRIGAAHRREDYWLKEADKATRAYTGEEGDGASNRLTFNILHSNVETIVPAIYNSTPTPDIRRRFRDPDETSRVLAQVIERCISVQIDDGALDVEIEALAQDAYVAGRGVVRVRVEDDNGRQKISFENVSWRDYAEGPAKHWNSVPWVAFRHTLTKESSDGIANAAFLSAQTEQAGYRYEGETTDDVIVWEVWCRKKREVLFIRANDGVVLKVEPDPLELQNFFPIADPTQPITITGRRMPVNPYSIYRELAEEIDLLTKRIRGIARGLKVRGAVPAGELATDIEAWAKAGDNEIVEIKGVEAFMQFGGMDKAITWWPVDKGVAVLRELVTQREATKQAIYEITGISDIVRGASQASETATAQQIKTQWGSLRIKKMQRSVERTVRSIFCIMAEIIATKFTPETMQEASGIQITPEMMALMQNPVLRTYRIDVESDSTVRGDVSRSQQEMNSFLQGTAQFIQAVGPAVQSGQMPEDVVVEIFSAFARTFKLGRQAEDALERMGEQAREMAKHPKPEKPDPAQMEIERKTQQVQAEMQMRQQEAMAGAEFEAQKMQSDMQSRQAELEMRMEIERAKLESEAALAREKIAMEYQIAREKLESDERVKLASIQSKHEQSENERADNAEREARAENQKIPD